MAEERTGTTVQGRYEIRRLLGEGGFGAVWLAYDRELQREVALKELLLHADGEEERLTRMRHEAMLVAQLDHPGVVRVYDSFRIRDRPWLVMEYIHGPSLHALVRSEGPLTARRAARIGLRVLDALDAVHRKRIAHRDIKPSNVLIAPDRTVLVDFGIAAMDGATRLTAAGQVIGSPEYMAPERYGDDRAVDFKTADLWSLGAMLHYAVTGRPPPRHDRFRRDRLPPDAAELGPVLEGLLRADPAVRMAPDEAAELLGRVAEEPDAARPPLVGDRIDQIVFRGGAGAEPVASSLRGAALREWSRLLRGGALVESVGDGRALGALRFGDRGQYGVVFTARQGAGGTPLVHALVGASEIIDHRLALALRDWDGWASDAAVPAAPPPLTVAELPARATVEDVPPPAAGIAETLVDGVLAAPTARYLLPLDGPGGEHADAAVARLLDTVEDLVGGDPWTLLLNALPSGSVPGPRLLGHHDSEATRADDRRVLETAPAAPLLSEPAYRPFLHWPEQRFTDADAARRWAAVQRGRLTAPTAFLGGALADDTDLQSAEVRLLAESVADGSFPAPVPDAEVIRLLEAVHAARSAGASPLREPLRLGALRRGMRAEPDAAARLVRAIGPLRPTPQEIRTVLEARPAEAGVPAAVAVALGLPLNTLPGSGSREMLICWFTDAADAFPDFVVACLRHFRADRTRPDHVPPTGEAPITEPDAAALAPLLVRAVIGTTRADHTRVDLLDEIAELLYGVPAAEAADKMIAALQTAGAGGPAVQALLRATALDLLVPLLCRSAEPETVRAAVQAIGSRSTPPAEEERNRYLEQIIKHVKSVIRGVGAAHPDALERTAAFETLLAAGLPDGVPADWVRAYCTERSWAPEFRAALLTLATPAALLAVTDEMAKQRSDRDSLVQKGEQRADALAARLATRTRQLVATVGAFTLLCALAGAAYWWRSDSSPKAGTSAWAEGPACGLTAPPTASTAMPLVGPPGSPGGGARRVPPGYRVHVSSEISASVALPQQWTSRVFREGDGTSLYASDNRSGGCSLYVDNLAPTGDLVQYARNSSRRLESDKRFAEYALLGIRTVDYAAAAVDWEFSAVENGRRYHRLTRYFSIAGGTYVIDMAVPWSEWDRARDIYGPIFASFARTDRPDPSPSP